jgi:succinoglycan biosynthesis transport protein ExoP
MNQHVDLRKTLLIILKKSWIFLLLAVLLGGGARFISMNYVDKIYQASTTMFIGKEEGSLGNIGLSLSELQASNELIVDYKEIANSRLVIEATMRNLNIDMDMEDFRKALSLEIIADSRLFSVSFASEDPQLAARVANELAKQLSIAVAEIVNVENIRIIDEALVPVEPVSPNVFMVTILAALIGFVLGLLIIYLFQIFNDTFSNQEDIEGALQLDVIAIIPKIKEEKSSRIKGLVTLDDPNSYLSESFKMCRTNINYMIKDDQQKVLMLTSSVASEGKTTTCSNLAVTIAQEHKKVLLIDGDLRKPNLYKMFKVTMMPGLTDILYGKYTLQEAVQQIPEVPGLDLLVAGRVTSMTTELLGSVSFHKLIEEARESYDVIIIDAPPVLNVSDTIIISKQVDKVLFVVAMEGTNKSLVKEAKRALEKVSVKMMGMILTNMSINPRSYYYSSSKPSGKSGRRKIKLFGRG